MCSYNEISQARGRYVLHAFEIFRHIFECFLFTYLARSLRIKTESNDTQQVI